MNYGDRHRSWTNTMICPYDVDSWLYEIREKLKNTPRYFKVTWGILLKVRILFSDIGNLQRLMHSFFQYILDEGMGFRFHLHLVFL